MTEDESRRFQELCALIILEKDEAKFSELVQELNVLVEAKEGRLKKQSIPG
jgi:hypothetical protein